MAKKKAKAAKRENAKNAGIKGERIAYGVLVSALGCIWLFAETGYLPTTLPIGPMIVIIIGIVMILPLLKD